MTNTKSEWAMLELYAIYQQFYRTYGPEPVPESAEIAGLWEIVEAGQ